LSVTQLLKLVASPKLWPRLLISFGVIARELNRATYQGTELTKTIAEFATDAGRLVEYEAER